MGQKYSLSEKNMGKKTEKKKLNILKITKDYFHLRNIFVTFVTKAFVHSRKEIIFSKYRMSNQVKLFDAVIENSISKDFLTARFEWDILDFSNYDTDCICGKKHIVKNYTIRNRLNGNNLKPIGSECIKKFQVEKLDEDMKIFNYRENIFNNKGKKYDGLTYHHICSEYPDYVKFLKSCEKLKTRYLKLIRYYDLVF